MTGTRRRRFSPALKLKVAEAALREEVSTAELAQRFVVHASLVVAWKRWALAAMGEDFAKPHARRREVVADPVLLAKIGEQQMRIDKLEGRLPQLLQAGRQAK